MDIFKHESVLTEEIMSFLKDCEGKTLVDATAGGGGHLLRLAKLVGKNGQVIAFDRDQRAHEPDAALGVKNSFPDIVKLFHRPFSEIKETLASLHIEKIDGIIADLGVSSYQLDMKERGFSFMADGPIDMRMDQSHGITAYEWLFKHSEKEIADAIFHLGGERKSRAIARLIKESWPIENSTLALAKLVIKAMRQQKWSKTHPATRTFQALRMAVNEEVNELMSLLKDLPELLALNGVAVFLSFHSIEDGLIKRSFKDLSHKNALLGSPQFMLLTKKPLCATPHEISHNRRARSAKLRAIKRTL